MSESRPWIRLGTVLLPAIPPWETSLFAQAGVRAGDEIRIRLLWRHAKAGLLVELEVRGTTIGDVPSGDKP